MTTKQSYISALQKEISKLSKLSLSQDKPMLVIVYANRIIALEKAIQLAKEIL